MIDLVLNPKWVFFFFFFRTGCISLNESRLTDAFWVFEEITLCGMGRKADKHQIPNSGRKSKKK